MSTSIDAPKLVERDTPASLDPQRAVHALVREARELHELEQAGESGWTPLVAISGLVVFFGVVFLVMAVLAEAAYHFIP
jgi:hypothetical protein